MMRNLRRFISCRDEAGASAVEYGLLVAGITALIVAIVFLFGGVVSKSFNNACGRLSAGASANSASTCK
jgi:pilus assembly protein Flp/PilA